MSTDIAKVPRGETIWVGYYNKDGVLKFVLTSKSSREYYFLYAVGEDGSCTKLGKSKSPVELERKFNVYNETR